MRLRRVVHTGAKGGAVWIGQQIKKLEIVLVLLTKCDARWAATDSHHVEFNRSVGERDVFERRCPIVQAHQAVKETKLLQELSVPVRLPVFRGHGDRDWFGGSGKRKSRQEAKRESQFRHDPSVWAAGNTGE